MPKINLYPMSSPPSAVTGQRPRVLTVHDCLEPLAWDAAEARLSRLLLRAHVRHRAAGSVQVRNRVTPGLLDKPVDQRVNESDDVVHDVHSAYDNACVVSSRL
jgi:hypothetical protein